MADSPAPAHRAPRSRFLPLAWISGLAAAALLVLGVSGTLSDWTSAVIDNSTNNALTSNAVVLQETGPDGTASHTSQTCYSSSGAGVSNSYTCANINKYGGVSAPLAPGGSQTATVVFTNIGSGPGATFTLTPGACSQTPAVGTGTPVNPANLCASNDLTVTMACNSGAVVGTPLYTDLAYSGTLAGFPGSANLQHAAGIAKGASVTCKFTVALAASASPLDGGITVSQDLSWNLHA